MSIVKLEWPTSGTPTVPDDYTLQNSNLLKAARGEGVSLSNWDSTTTAPQVPVGSVVFSNDVYYTVTVSAETISTSGASSGTVYLILDDTAGSEEFAWTDTAPTWDAALNGWYVSGDRATGHTCIWDGASSYTGKNLLVRGFNTKVLYGTLNASGVGTITHGLTSTDIVSVSVFGDLSSGVWSAATAIPSTVNYGATVITVSNATYANYLVSATIVYRA